MKRVLGFLLLGLLLGGCGSGGFSSRSAAKVGKGELVVAIATNPTSLDPGVVQDVATSELLANVYEGLVGYGQDNKIIGLLAESWTSEDGGRTFVFKLRNAKFQNGKTLSADDVKATFERNLDPKFNSPTAAVYLSDIVGVRERLDGKASEVRGIKVRDPKTISFTLDQPRAYFLGKLTLPCGYIMPNGQTKEEMSSLATMVGTGPFQIASFASEQELVLEAFPGYWGGAPKLARIRRPVVKDASTRLNMMKSGETSYLDIARSDVKEAAADPKLKKLIQWLPRPALWYIGLNAKAYAPFKDIRVRRAFAMGFDRNKLCKNVLEGAPEADGLIPPGIMGNRPNYKGLPMNVEEARRCLAEAGFPGGKGLPALTITIRDQTADARLIAETYASEIKKNLGFEIKIQTMEWRSLLEARNKSELQLYVLSWYGDYLDPENFLSLLLRSDSPQSRDGYLSPEFDRLCKLADAEQDAERRSKLYEQAEDTAIEEAARIPIFFLQDGLIVGPKVRGIRSNLIGLMPHQTVEVAE